jgi:hypothetical protein
MADVVTLSDLQYHTGDAPLFPARLYLFGADGRHSGGKWLRTEADLREALDTTVRAALIAKREVRITDPGDMLVFHAVDGEIVFPTREQCEATR